MTTTTTTAAAAATTEHPGKQQLQSEMENA